MKTILVTGGTGFIGKNLIAKLRENNSYQLLSPGREVTDEELRAQLKKADYIFHLAGVSRPQDPKEFYEGNSGLTEKIVALLREEKLSTPILYTSSIHAVLENDFGTSKKRAEDTLLEYQKDTGAKVYIVRLTNTFGRWAKPNAHSVVATFCYNIARDLEIQISDRSKEMTLAYIDDVIEAFTSLLLEDKISETIALSDIGFYGMTKVYMKTLGEMADILYRIKGEDGVAFPEEDEFAQRLLVTYQSYKP